MEKGYIFFSQKDQCALGSYQHKAEALSQLAQFKMMGLSQYWVTALSWPWYLPHQIHVTHRDS